MVKYLRVLKWIRRRLSPFRAKKQIRLGKYELGQMKCSIWLSWWEVGLYSEVLLGYIDVKSVLLSGDKVEAIRYAIGDFA